MPAPTNRANGSLMRRRAHDATAIMLLPILLPSALCYSTLSTFTPGAFMIKRQIGQLGFATETEWAYNKDGVPVAPNPLDPSQPKRTIDASGVSVRLFDAKLYAYRRSNSAPWQSRSLC